MASPYLARGPATGSIGRALNRPTSGPIAVLDVDDQHGAHGKFLSTGAYFMELRPAGGRPLMTRPDPPDGPAEPYRMPLSAWEETAFTFLVSFALSCVDILTDASNESGLTIWHRDGSIAHMTVDGKAQQAGPQRLADLLGQLWTEYEAHGKPPQDAYRMTVTPAGARAVTVECQGGATWRVVPRHDGRQDQPHADGPIGGETATDLPGGSRL